MPDAAPPGANEPDAGHREAPSLSTSPPAFDHAPILAPTIVELARAHGCVRLIDCTLGGAGHSTALLEALPQARLLAFDRDSTAIAVGKARLARFGERVKIVHAPFAELAEHLHEAPFSGRADFVMADFGVSSHQLDTPGRGFSFRTDGPIDMRMDPSRGESAQALIDRLDADALADIIYRYGEERHSRRVARAILAHRPRTTLALAEVVRAQVPKKPGKKQIDGATRTFQALRMAVNDELGQIEALLQLLPTLLDDGGLFAALSFHSLEDRMVKRALQAYVDPCTCPPDLPMCACARVPLMRQPQRRAVTAEEDELGHNPRARSARLRWALRLPRAPAAPESIEPARFAPL